MDELEFDEDKSQANLNKHGMDFEDARELWDDGDTLDLRQTVAKTRGATL